MVESSSLPNWCQTDWNVTAIERKTVRMFTLQLLIWCECNTFPPPEGGKTAKCCNFSNSTKCTKPILQPWKKKEASHSTWVTIFGQAPAAAAYDHWNPFRYASCYRWQVCLEKKAITLEERYQAASRWYKLKPNTMAPSQVGILGNLIQLFPGPATNSGQVFLTS